MDDVYDLGGRCLLIHVDWSSMDGSSPELESRDRHETLEVIKGSRMCVMSPVRTRPFVISKSISIDGRCPRWLWNKLLAVGEAVELMRDS